MDCLSAFILFAAYLDSGRCRRWNPIQQAWQPRQQLYLHLRLMDGMLARFIGTSSMRSASILIPAPLEVARSGTGARRLPCALQTCISNYAWIRRCSPTPVTPDGPTLTASMCPSSARAMTPASATPAWATADSLECIRTRCAGLGRVLLHAAAEAQAHPERKRPHICWPGAAPPSSRRRTALELPQISRTRAATSASDPSSMAPSRAAKISDADGSSAQP